ncbi:hypothetical protein B0684_05510 [Thioalkalivibrio versutus]|nr:hypothetical protein B0684_05510 [Thioalkalivibrio versutus]
MASRHRGKAERRLRPRGRASRLRDRVNLKGRGSPRMRPRWDSSASPGARMHRRWAREHRRDRVPEPSQPIRQTPPSQLPPRQRITFRPSIDPTLAAAAGLPRGRAGQVRARMR